MQCSVFWNIGVRPHEEEMIFSKETINENESIGYWRCSNNYIKFCGRHIGRYKVWKGEL